MTFFKKQHVVVTFYDLEVYMKKNNCPFIEQARKNNKKYALYEVDHEIDLSLMETNFTWKKGENKIMFYKKK